MDGRKFGVVREGLFEAVIAKFFEMYGYSQNSCWIKIVYDIFPNETVVM